MTKKQEIYIHLGFWVLFIGMNLFFDLVSERDFLGLWNVLQFIAFNILQIIIFYLNYYWICRKTVPGKKWAWLITGQLFLIFLFPDRKSTRLNSSHVKISYAVFCLKKKIHR